MCLLERKSVSQGDTSTSMFTVAQYNSHYRSSVQQSNEESMAYWTIDYYVVMYICTNGSETEVNYRETNRTSDR